MAEIAAIVVSVISPAIELGKLLKRPLNYLCCFTSNIQTLKDESEKLKTERDGLQIRVDAAERNIQVIVPQVNQWFEAYDQIQARTNGVEVETENVKRGCFAIKSQYSLSRKAKNTAEAMKDLREKCKFEEISVPPPPAAMAPIRPETTSEFESRKQIEEKIMNDLKDRKVRMMGISGMGGVGKTTMAKKIMKRLKEENAFEEVVMVAISQEVRMQEIQSEIAEKLGLTLSTEESLSVRAHKLHARLKGPEKSILLIFDDVWKELNLEDLGIPCKSDLGERCAIVLTSRNRDVLTKMDAKPYAMKILTENESWSLFREKVGTWVDDSELLSIAKEVEKECKGLPLALVIVGMALKNEKEKSIWEDALHQLRSANPTAMPDVLMDLYKPLKLSYDFLDMNSAARSLFLLCCLFPEDWEIPLESLTMYGVGLRMFDGTASVEEARNRVRTLLKTLKGLFLLQDGRDENHVRMHDIVRDVATFIASKEERVRSLSSIDSSSEESINCTWISVDREEIDKLTAGLSFPRLHLLLMNGSRAIPDSLFKGLTELKVLSVLGDLLSLPVTTQLLKKLRTLHLEGCSRLSKIPVVGNLLSLEILICRHCRNLKELPVEIGRLKRLKLLEVSYCGGLQRIAPGVISNLVQLEELTIVRSFSGWETKAKNGEQTENAALCELEHLKSLTTLRIEIMNANLATEEIRLSSNIEKYNIDFSGNAFEGPVQYLYDKELYERKMRLRSDSPFEKWIQMFVTRTDYLQVGGEGARTLDIAQAQKMKKFVLKNCSKVNLTASTDWSFGVFPILESLTLHNLSNLGEICDGPILKSSNSFGNLKELNLQKLPALQHIWKSPHQNVSLCNLSKIILSECDKLRELFPLAIARKCLPELGRLTVRSCSMMEQMFSDDENEVNDGEQCHSITFAKLRYLHIQHLPKLQRFCNWRHDLQFPSLQSMTIYKCRPLLEFFTMESGRTPKLESIQIGRDNVSKIWGHQTPVGFFRQLQRVRIENCNGIRSLFSASMAENLLHLEQLSIIKCSEMIKVIEDDEEMSCEKSNLVFPCLKGLKLVDLPKLESFCNCGCDLQLPSLKQLGIFSCRLSGFFTIESVKFGSVKKICIDDWKISRSLFPYSVAEKLVNLEHLEIRGCNEMAQVIDDDEELLGEKSNPLFPCLKTLQFNYLPKLESFWNWRCDLELPSLKKVEIIGCRLFKRFSSMGSVTTPNLKDIRIDYEGKAVGDLNRVIQLHFT